MITLRTKLTDLLAGLDDCPLQVIVYSAGWPSDTGSPVRRIGSWTGAERYGFVAALEACDNPAAAKVTVDVYQRRLPEFSDDDETMCLVDTYHLEA